MLLAIDHGHAIAFDRYGDEGARPVVLLHGLSNARTTYAAVVDHLLHTSVGRGDIQLINADLRGHGESSHASLDEYEATHYAADVAALIEHVDAGPALVVGHSLGGVVAMALAAAHPMLVGRLLLEDPPLFEGDHERRAASPVASFFPDFVAAVRERQERHAELDDYVALIADRTDPEVLDDRAEAISRWDPTTMEAAIDGVVWRSFDPVAPVACPVTVLRADPSLGAVFTAADEATLQRANPQAEVFAMEGAAHSIHDPATRAAYLQHLDAAVRAFVEAPH